MFLFCLIVTFSSPLTSWTRAVTIMQAVNNNKKTWDNLPRIAHRDLDRFVTHRNWYWNKIWKIVLGKKNILPLKGTVWTFIHHLLFECFPLAVRSISKSPNNGNSRIESLCFSMSHKETHSNQTQSSRLSKWILHLSGNSWIVTISLPFDIVMLCLVSDSWQCENAGNY